MKKIQFPIRYRSINIIKNKKNKIINKITKKNLLRKEDVKKNFIVVKVQFANLNYKDFLMFQGHNGLIKKFPHTPGIDACGTVYYSNSSKFKRYQKVFIIAQPLGVDISGSLSEYILVPEHWVEKLPNNLSSKEIMMIGTSGFTAVKAFNKSLKTILKHKNRPVLVTGATGNVGMHLIYLLSSVGVNIEAISSKTQINSVLKKIGVKKIHTLENFLRVPNFPLLNEKYSVVFDNLGGDVIPVCLKYLIKKGILISIGNILGNTSNLNILPLILREVSILSVNTECSEAKERREILNIFKSSAFKNKLLQLTKVIKLTEVPKLMKFEKYKKKKLRYVVKI